MKEKEVLQTLVLPEYKEIPDVGLYLDQVTKYINGLLVSYPEMYVTPSMISNYVKLKIVSKAEKKTYAREQIACFIFIAFAKTVLSMEQIRQCFEMQKKIAKSELAYEYFRAELLRVMSSFQDTSTKQSTKGTEKEEAIMIRNVCVTVVHKMYLDRYFEIHQTKKASK